VRFGLRAVVANLALAGAIVIVACGARTGLLTPDDFGVADAGTPIDATVDGALDSSSTECSPNTYCDPNDPGHVYKCNQAVATCGLLEQCEDGEGVALSDTRGVFSPATHTTTGCDF
jgi:hypothetical protein